MASGQGSNWLIESPTIFHQMFLNIFTPLAVTQSVDNLFNSFTVLCENEYFLLY